MRHQKMLAILLCAAGLALAGCEQARPDAVQSATDTASDVHLLTWEDLVPEGEEERLAELYAQQYASAVSLADVEEGGASDIAVQTGSYETVDTFDAVRVRLPGYAVPFDYSLDTKIAEFLLVPYFGACLHAPPPPPNQTVYVTLADPIELRDLAQAVWVEGILRTTTATTDLADAAYTIEVDKVEAY